MGKVQSAAWLENAISFEKSNNPGVCPRCGFSDVIAEEYAINGRKSLTLSCPACGGSAHFDKVLAPDR